MYTRFFNGWLEIGSEFLKVIQRSNFYHTHPKILQDQKKTNPCSDSLLFIRI
jgi:hypothetical protein